MTEYDYSPEAYDRYIQTQSRVANWVHHTEQHRQLFEAAAPGAPGMPPVRRTQSPPLEYYPISRGQHRSPTKPPSHTRPPIYQRRAPTPSSDESVVYVHPPQTTTRSPPPPRPIYTSPPPQIYASPPPQSYHTPAVVIVDGSSSRRRKRHRQSQSHSRTYLPPPQPLRSPIYTSPPMSPYYPPPGYPHMVPFGYPEHPGGRPVISRNGQRIPSPISAQNGKRPFYPERPLTPPLTPSRLTSSSSSSDLRSPPNRISLPNLPQLTPGVDPTPVASGARRSPSSYYLPSRTLDDQSRSYSYSSGVHRRHHQPRAAGHPITAVVSGLDPSHTARDPLLDINNTIQPNRHTHLRHPYRNQSNNYAAHTRSILDMLHSQPPHIVNSGIVMQQQQQQQYQAMQHGPGEITVFVPSKSQTRSSEGEDSDEEEGRSDTNGSHSPSSIASLTHNQTALMGRRLSKWPASSSARNLQAWDHPRTRVAAAPAVQLYPWPT